MEEKSTTEKLDPKGIVGAYLDAVAKYDLTQSVSFFADDSTLSFMNGVFRGQKAIEDWHRDRFAAELEFVKLDSIKAKGDTVTVDGSVTSKKLKAWKIGKLAGRATFKVQDGKIKETKFSLRMYNPLEGW